LLDIKILEEKDEIKKKIEKGHPLSKLQLN